ncbi:methionyl-tRNA formyltransferase [Candidatus Falkowbacteria bacterium CG11_big_fil_rev_8_21_14_0_20_39_10]|uniref:Methionyl-tRNA formyltransferase n=1 Tax=Candidatus Falkowbacteria bacterium CG11_big_fil_rev_8_21_14_0_20_39_10 TaxID=1974570 RepID=A0A2M6KA02_9BACT|nr:MAG: methionyl-tRNA formyltransferase [Candidatus Falkowbacteria bacterium CG11_big_fil_rev_8_21_14_0_20_39_10]
MREQNEIKTIFIGTPEFAVPTFMSLVKDDFFDIQAVVTQPDKKVNRKQTLTPPPIKIKAQENNIRVYQPEKISDFQLPASPNRSEPIADFDLAVVISYGQIIPKKILNILKYGSINVHGSLLPRYRGAACIQAPILNGDKESGITIIKMDAGLDTGPILAQNKIKLDTEETASSLHDKLSKLSAQILPKAIKDYVKEKIKPIPQDKTKATYVRELKKEDGRIDWKKPAVKIERMVRAFNPWPGVFTQVKSKKLKVESIKFLEVEHKILKVNKYKIGELFLDNNKLAVQCGRDALVIKKLQLAGKKPMSAEEFLRGHKNLVGQILK